MNREKKQNYHLGYNASKLAIEVMTESRYGPDILSGVYTIATVLPALVI